MPNSKIDALIVGAGPVGLTLAAALTHQGQTYRLIEKAPAPTDKSKALVLWSRTMELFNPLGLTKIFLENGLKAKGGNIFADHKRLVHFTLTGDESPFGFPLMIPQSETERILLEHLAHHGIEVDRQVELMSFDESADLVLCQLRHADGREESVETPWLIGCDGAHSTVRHLMGVPFTGHAEPNDWLLADLHIEGPLAPDEVSIFWHRTGMLVFFPITRDRFRVIADLGKADQSAPLPDLTLAEVQAKVDERGPGDLTMSDPVWLSNFRINERKVADYRRGRIMLAGDAAHVHSPAGGQGMNTGMQDAFNLAWKVAFVQEGKGQAEALLHSYSVERSAIGDQVLKNAENFTTVATLHNPIAQSLRNHLAPIITSFQFFQDKVRREWWEISLNYRHSPLSAHDGPGLKGALSAGDRLCDAPLTSMADGRSSTLFATMDGIRCTLLLLPGNDGGPLSELLEIADEVGQTFPGALSTEVILKSDAPDPGTGISNLPIWVDMKGRVYEKLHAAHPTLVLVRPDGYIGYRGQLAGGEALKQYLSGFLVSRLPR
jgi:2-polyprenyl-6-methoxyphenol hydroxylase-like FAD-dependent oxidoreductase